MENAMLRDFISKALSEWLALYDYSSAEVESYDEIVMSTYMMDFAQNYDNQNDIRFDNISEVTSRVLTIGGKTNGDGFVGHPRFYSKTNADFFRKEEPNKKTEDILKEIRNCVAHGKFEIGSDEPKTVTIFANTFEMTFYFDCFIELCQIIFDQLEEIQKDDSNKLFSFTECKSFFEDINGESSINYKLKYPKLRYAQLLYILMPLNENVYFNYKKLVVKMLGINGDGSEKIKHYNSIRNSLVHGGMTYEKQDKKKFIGYFIDEGENSQKCYVDTKIIDSNIEKLVQELKDEK